MTEWVSTDLRFEVAVSKAVFVHVPKALDELGANDLCVRLGEGLVHVALEVSVLDILHCNEDHILVLVPAIELNEAIDILVNRASQFNHFPQKLPDGYAREESLHRFVPKFGHCLKLSHVRYWQRGILVHLLDGPELAYPGPRDTLL